MSDEVEVLAEAYCNTGSYTNTPCYQSVAVYFVTGNFTFVLAGCYTEAHVEEKTNGAELCIAPTCVGVN